MAHWLNIPNRLLSIAYADSESLAVNLDLIALIRWYRNPKGEAYFMLFWENDSSLSSVPMNAEDELILLQQIG